MLNELGRVEDVVTVGIKHTSNFARRRVMLNMLLRSVRQEPWAVTCHSGG